MFRSHMIEVSDQFADAAVTQSGRYRFIAVDPQVHELDNSSWPSLTEVQRVVGQLVVTGRLPVAPVEADP